MKKQNSIRIYTSYPDRVELDYDAYEKLVSGIKDPREKSRGFNSIIAIKMLAGLYHEIDQEKSLVVKARSKKRLEEFMESEAIRVISQKTEVSYKPSRR